MKYLLVAALLLPTPALAAWEQIDSESDLKRYVLNKAFEDPKTEAWFQINRNGSLSGGYKGIALKGKWKWSGKYLCTFDRVLGKKKQNDSCIVIRVNGRALETIRKKGKGRVTKYRRR